MAERAALGRGALFFALLLLFFALLATRAALRPPPPESAEAPPARFSEARARAVLARLIPHGTPHPVGSLENERVRRRIEDELRRVGLVPKLQEAVACGGRGTCARVQNVIARIEGQQPGPTVLLAAHYDSVGAGPGAADDGSGVAAIIEVARSLSKGEKPLLPVLLLIDDGEEVGLLGAKAFVADEELSRDVRVVVNLEARGTNGPSLLFETTKDDAWLLARVGPKLAHPVTSSLFYAVYRRMPNDTDLSVFRAHGFHGVGFAFIGGVPRYHTPLDDLEHLDGGSLQHQGDNALSAVRALSSSAVVESPPRGEAVYFDLLGRTVVSWPILWARILAGLALALAIVGFALLRRRAGLSFAGTALGLLRLSAFIAVAVVLGTLAERVWKASGALPTPFPAHPGAFAAACMCAGALAVAVGSKTARHAVDEWAAAQAFWLVGAAVLAVLEPKASFVLLLPGLGAALATCIGFARRQRQDGALALGVLVFAVLLWIVWLPLSIMLDDAIGFAVPGVTAAVWTLILSPFVPLLSTLSARARTRIVIGACVAFLGSVGIAAAQKPFSREAPQRMSIALSVEPNRTRWLVDASGGPISEAFAERTKLGSELVDPSPWLGGWGPQTRAAEGPTIDLPPPDAELIASAPRGVLRHLRLRLRSKREARVLTVEWPANARVSGVALEGKPVTPWPTAKGYRVVFAGPSQEGAVLELDTSAAPLSLLIADHTPGFPRGLNVPARPVTAAASQHGDVTVVSRRVSF